MPCNYKNYSKDWKSISKQVIKEAGERCELCYAPNKEFISRNKKEAYPWRLTNLEEKAVQVILTVHHIDSDKKNDSRRNLIALCQRCHLRLDLHKHVENAKETRLNKAKRKKLREMEIR